MKACSEKGFDGSNAEYIETVHVIAAADHVISSASHVMSSADHVTTSADHVMPSADHVMSSADHVISSASHVITSANHMMSQADHMTSADHVTTSSDYVIPQGDHVITTAESDAIDSPVYSSVSSATVSSGVSRAVNVLTDPTGSVVVFSGNNDVITDGGDSGDMVEYTAMLSGP